MFAAAFVPTDNALDVRRLIRLRAAGLRAVGLAAGGSAGRQGVPGGQDRAGGYQTGDVLWRSGRCQMRGWHRRRRAYLKGSAAATAATAGCAQGSPGVPRGPRGRRRDQRHRGGGAARREPQLQRGGELGVVMSGWHPTREQRRRRGRVNHPGSRQGVRAYRPASNHPAGFLSVRRDSTDNDDGADCRFPVSSVRPDNFSNRISLYPDRCEILAQSMS